MNKKPYMLPEPELADLLNLRASQLSFPAFAYVAKRVLEYVGIECVELKGRRFFRGRTPLGGFDMEGFEETEAGRLRVLIQLKRYHRAVDRRFIDELRGTIFRYAAPCGIIITTTSFTVPARDAAASYPGRPIRVMDGCELGRIMLEARIGVTTSIDPITGENFLTFDEAAFERLEDYCELLYNNHHKGRS